MARKSPSTATDNVLLLPVVTPTTAGAATPKQKKKKADSGFTLTNVLTLGQPLLVTGLSVLEQVKIGQPYIAALRLLVAAGSAYLANDQAPALERIKTLRKKIRELRESDVKRVALQKKLDLALDQL